MFIRTFLLSIATAFSIWSEHFDWDENYETAINCLYIMYDYDNALFD